MESPLYKPKEKNNTKPGRPPKIKTNIINNKDITDYFIKQE